MRADLRRRSVLAAAVLTVPLVAAGCKGVGGLGTLPKAAPDVAVLHHAIATEQALIARYHTALAGSPGLAGTLRPLLAQHREHLARLTSMLIVPATPRAPRPSVSATAGTTVPRAATIAALEAAETDAASSLLRRLALAPPALAQLLASIAASEASHALLLRTDGRGDRVTGGTGSAGPGSASTGSASTGQIATALQSALAAENAAVYGYGVAGAQLGATARDLALQDWTVHQMARDRLEAMLTSLRVKPAAAQPAYQLPFPVHGTGAAISLAGYLENQVAAAYLGIVALDDPRLRAWGAAQAQACALRATTWLGRTAAFPGLTSGLAAPAQPSASP